MLANAAAGETPVAKKSQVPTAPAARPSIVFVFMRGTLPGGAGPGLPCGDIHLSFRDTIMPKLIRSACLTNYVEVARSIGLDPYRQLKAAGLSRACLADPDTMIRASAVGRLLEASAHAAGVEDFGLRMAETRRLSILGPIGLLLQELADGVSWRILKQ